MDVEEWNCVRFYGNNCLYVLTKTMKTLVSGAESPYLGPPNAEEEFLNVYVLSL
jgi:hypothetical protein